MKKVITNLAVVVSLSTLMIGTSSAQSIGETADSITSGWSGTATLGASSATGNSEASSISGSIRLDKTVEKWEHLLFGSVFKGNSTIIVEERDDNNDIVLGDDGRPVRRIIKGDNSNRI
nr:hypothetical protein [Granulosicoccus sp.]